MKTIKLTFLILLTLGIGACDKTNHSSAAFDLGFACGRAFASQTCIIESGLDSRIENVTFSTPVTFVLRQGPSRINSTVAPVPLNEPGIDIRTKSESRVDHCFFYSLSPVYLPPDQLATYIIAPAKNP